MFRIFVVGFVIIVRARITVGVACKYFYWARVELAESSVEHFACELNIVARDYSIFDGYICAFFVCVPFLRFYNMTHRPIQYFIEIIEVM